MKFLKVIFSVLVLAVTFSFSAFAETGDYQLAVHTGSKHFQEGFNGSNPGLGLRIKDGEETYYQFGAYHNSVKRTTLYAIYGYQPYKIGNFTFGGFVGLASGYGVTGHTRNVKKCTGKVCETLVEESQTPNSSLTPAAGLTVTAHFKNMNIVLVGIPSVRYKGDHPGSLSLTLMFPF